MSLASRLMSGAYYGTTSINPAKYGHAEGASVIAMESVAELHDIFMEDYNYEQAELAAISEGVVLEGSQYEAVAENAITNTFKKVKEFLKKLLDKIKAFFHNVLRFFDSIAKSGKEFVIKYKSDIDDLEELDDYTVEMYDFNDKAIDSQELNDEPFKKIADVAVEVAKHVESAVSYIKSNTYSGPSTGKSMMDAGKVNGQTDKDIEELKKVEEEDDFYRSLTDNKADSADEYRTYLLNMYRGGEDKEKRTIKKADVKAFATTLTNGSSASKFKTLQGKADKAFATAIKAVDDAEKKCKDVDSDKATRATKAINLYSKYISKAQNVVTADVNVRKQVFKERDAAYKSVIMGAFRAKKKK